MFGSTVLDIGIGLVLTYLFLSLVVTAANELSATFTRARATDLERGIRNLLDGKSDVPERWWDTVLRLCRWGAAPRPGQWSIDFFEHPLIKALSQDHAKPCYVPAPMFATVLMDLVQRSSGKATSPATTATMNLADIRAALEKIESPDGQDIKRALLPLIEEARNDPTGNLTELKKFTMQIECWFNHAMDRVSGWYIRRTKWFLFAIAIVFTVALNVDTVAICRRLGKDDTLRASVVESAKQFTAQAARDGVTTPVPQTAHDPQDLALGLKRVQDEVGRLNGLGIPLGWTYDPIPNAQDVEEAIEKAARAVEDKQAAQISLEAAEADAKQHPGDIPRQVKLTVAKSRLQIATQTAASANATLEEKVTKQIVGHPIPREDDWYDVCHSDSLFVWTKLLGLFLTAFAASLGAPFWFDVLNKFMSVRGSGRAPEERPTAPRVAPATAAQEHPRGAVDSRSPS